MCGWTLWFALAEMWNNMWQWWCMIQNKMNKTDFYSDSFTHSFLFPNEDNESCNEFTIERGKIGNQPSRSCA